MKEVIPLVAESMGRAQQETGEAKLFSANITADFHEELIHRGEFVLEQFAKYDSADHVAFLVDGLVAGPIKAGRNCRVCLGGCDYPRYSAQPTSTRFN